MKLKAPEGCTGISIGGNWYETDKTGHCELPDTINIGDAESHGYTVVNDEPAQSGKGGRKKKSDSVAPADAAAPADGDQDAGNTEALPKEENAADGDSVAPVDVNSSEADA